MDKKKLLIISISAPPKNAPESLQAGKYFKYLNKEYFDITLVTSKVIGGWRPYDEGLNRYLIGINKVIEVPTWNNRYIPRIIRFLSPSFLEMPDEDAPFHWRHRYIKKKTQENKPDIIYSRSTPISSAILALKLKSYYPVPWVMHLSDPWVDNPYLRIGKKGRKYNEAMESRCFQEADKITVTSQKTLDLYSHKYPSHAKKLLVFPNVYDPDLEEKVTDSLPKNLTFVHTGRLYGSRNAKSMILAIERFISKNPECESQINFLFAGFADNANQELFNQCGLQCVKYLGALTYDESVTLQQNAHVLVNIDSDEKDDRFKLFFPSKILDYFLARKKILCITANNSTTESIVNGKYGHCFTHDDIQSISNYIAMCFTKFSSEEDSFFCNPDIPFQFSASANAQKLSALLNEL